MTLTAIQSTVTKTAAFTGSNVAINAITGDWTLKVQVQALSDSGSATPSVRITFEDSVDGPTFISGPSISFIGTIGASYDMVRSFRKADYPDLRFGVSGGLIRAKLANIESTGSCTYYAWMEY